MKKFVERETSVSPATPIAPLLTGCASPVPLHRMSPLRYPGSKRKILPAIRQLIEGNVPKPELFVEPFCGGASISLGLLLHDVVERVMLADLDPLVASFWREVCLHGDRFVDDVWQEPVTLERWDYWRSSEPRTQRERAMKCFFLARTTFSGIVGGTAGPIGGRAQTSDNTIDCRFDKEKLARRLINVRDLYRDGRIVGIHRRTWRSAIDIAECAAVDHGASATMYYLDPPYIQKANRIYNLFFSDRDHKALARFLTESTDHRWILSYDREPLVLDLYRTAPGVSEYDVVHHYTMQGAGRKEPVPGREVLFTNLPINPLRHKDIS